MSWMKYLQDAVQLSVTCRVFAAFNANVDVIIKVTPQSIARILDQEPRLSQKIQQNQVHDSPIASPEAFLRVLKECLSTGKSYYDVVDLEMGGWFEEYFPERTEAMGGQAGIIANQMAALGAPTFVYNSILSERQAAIYNPQIQFPTTIHNRLHWVPIQAGINDSWTKINFIFEYPQGSTYTFGDYTVTTPRANRIILGTRSPKAAMAFSDALIPILPQIGACVDCGFMAGYHHGPIVGRNHSLEEYIELSVSQRDRLRLKNPNLRLHYEYVPMRDVKDERRLLERLLPGFESFGINENEIRRVLACLGYDGEANEISHHERAISLYIGALALLRQFRIPRIQVHNLGYYIVVLAKPYPVPPEDVRQACLFASAVNGVKARQGGAVPKGDVARMAAVGLSEIGYSQLDQFAEEARSLGYPVPSDFKETGIMEWDDHHLLLVPAHVVPEPVSTVGMGDTISSSAFAAEVSSFREGRN